MKIGWLWLGHRPILKPVMVPQGIQGSDWQGQILSPNSEVLGLVSHPQSSG